ncbi:MAG: hypothetical protein R3F43_29450 [bacterium]
MADYHAEASRRGGRRGGRAGGARPRQARQRARRSRPTPRPPRCRQTLSDAEARVARLEDDRRRILGGQRVDAVEGQLAEAVTRAEAASEQRYRERERLAGAAEGARAEAAATQREAQEAEEARLRGVRALGAALAGRPAAEGPRPAPAPGRLARAEAEALARLDAAGRPRRRHRRRAPTQPDAEAHEAHRPGPTRRPRRRGRPPRPGPAPPHRAADPRPRRAPGGRPRPRRPRRPGRRAGRGRRYRRARWGELDRLIGSANGNKFDFAQSLTLEAVLYQANRRLEELAPRYPAHAGPQREPGHPGHRSRDGRRDPAGAEPLGRRGRFWPPRPRSRPLAAVGLTCAVILHRRGLRQPGRGHPGRRDRAPSTPSGETGRQVGVISHVPGLAERLGLQVRVEPRAAG